MKINISFTKIFYDEPITKFPRFAPLRPASPRFAPLRLILALLAFIWAWQPTAQGQFSCGTPDITPQQYADYLQQVGNAQVASSPTANLPIWFTVVRPSNPNLSSQWDTDFNPQALVSAVNGYFTNGIQFYVCGVTYITDHDEWNELNLFTEWSAIRAASYQNECINVYCVQSMFQPLPNGSVYYDGYSGFPFQGNHSSTVIAIVEPEWI